MKTPDVADKIRLYRLSKNYSQENMAAELGLSVGAYSNLERGKTEISITRLYKIAKILKVDVLTFIKDSTTDKMMVNEPAGEYSNSRQLSQLNAKMKEYEQMMEKQRDEIGYLKEIILLLKKNKAKIDKKK